MSNQSIAERTIPVNKLVAAGMMGKDSIEVNDEALEAVNETLVHLIMECAKQGIGPEELIVAFLSNADTLAISAISAEICAEQKVSTVEEAETVCEAVAEKFISKKEKSFGVTKEPEFEMSDDLKKALAMFKGMRGAA